MVRLVHSLFVAFAVTGIVLCTMVGVAMWVCTLSLTPMPPETIRLMMQSLSMVAIGSLGLLILARMGLSREIVW
ncbi:MAG: hypothetical protein OEV43_08965 [Coriobacteriia bacterium]|nr:hypothetical protein [Coriobacteriia bacterium]